MSKITNTTVSSDIVSSDLVKYVGTIPACAISTDCQIDSTQLTYLLGILLTRYCDEFNIIDADLSSVDIACLIANNPDVIVPTSITIQTLSQYYSDVICKIYTKISDLTTRINNINGIICMNDLVTLNENTNITVDSLFNDVIIGISGTVVLTLVVGTGPYNGTASVVSNKVIYTPNTNFVGNDTLQYQVTKGGYTCKGTIKFSVTPVLTPATITDIVTSEIVALLASDDYWDIGIPVGAKLGISQINITDFFIDPSGLNLTSGKGKPGTKWSKWAICNGKNGTENFTNSTFRGYNETNTAYNLSTKAGGADTQTLVIGNIPPHRHKYFDAFLNAVDGSSEIFSAKVDQHASSEGVNQGPIYNSTIEITEAATGPDRQAVWYDRNTGDGTTNINGQGGLSTPVAFSVKNEFKTLILVQKVDSSNPIPCPSC